MSVVVDPGALVAGPLRPPRSKSDAQRALVLSHALGRAAPDLGAIEDQPRDPRIVVAALARFGEAGAVDVDCHDGGAPFRFLVAQAALRRAETRFSGNARLAARPHRALFDALRRGLPGLVLDGEPWPLIVRGVAPPAELSFSVDASESSQPLSALLLVGAAHVARGGVRSSVEATTAIASEGYLELTLSWLRRAGVSCARGGARISIDAVDAAATLPAVPADWSAAGYLLLVAWASGGWVEGLGASDEHPDRSVLARLAAIGLTVGLDGDRATVRGVPRAGLDVEVDRAPDLAPTLAALACVLPAPSRLGAIDVLRHKESDRVAAIVALVECAGGHAVVEDRTIVITPPGRLPERLVFDARDDHRMAMSAATLSVLLRRPLELVGHEHVDKSFPAFWRELGRAGVRVG